LASSDRDGAPVETAAVETVPEKPDHQEAGSNGNGATAQAAAVEATPATEAGKKDDKQAWDPAAWRMDPAALAPLEFKPLDGGELMWSRFKLAFALPWRRFKKGSVLAFKVRVQPWLHRS
jgi:protease-4